MAIDLDEDGAMCLICHESLLGGDEETSAGALRCGHVYHVSCVVSWLVSNKSPSGGSGSCPQCKKPCHPEDVRKLDFEVAAIEMPSAAEVRRVQAATEAERGKLKEELKQAIADVEADLVKADAQRVEVTTDAAECKERRREVSEQLRQLEAETTDLQSDLAAATEQLAELQANFDAQTKKLQRRLPIARPREEDADLRDERRALRSLRPGDRVRQLHDALVAAMRQEALSSASLHEHERTLQEALATADELRRLEAKLKRELSERQSVAAEATKTSDESLQASHPEAVTLRKEKARRLGGVAPSALAPAGGKLDAGVSGKSARVEVEDFTMTARAAAPVGFGDDDTDLLFGAPGPGSAALRGAGSKFGGLLGRSASGAGNALAGRGGVLAGGGSNFRPAQLDKTNTMKSLFNGRRI